MRDLCLLGLLCLACLSKAGAQTNPLKGWEIPPTSSYTGKFVEVKGTRMHYVEAGQGQPVLMLHGNPTSSFLWRNVMPYVAPHARVIALDLIGMGQSGKPSINYTFSEHAEYVEAFVNALQLKDVVTVGQDWGSALAFDYAARHANNMRGLVFFEAFLKPFVSDQEFRPAFRTLLGQFRTPGVGEELLIDQNLFVNQILPGQTQRPIHQQEWLTYRSPYADPKHRTPVMQWPREIPIDGQPATTHQRMTNYSAWLRQTNLPKLMLYASPGALMPADKVAWAQAHLSELTSVDLGQGVHHLQEENPHALGAAIAVWLQTAIN